MKRISEKVAWRRLGEKGLFGSKSQMQSSVPSFLHSLIHWFVRSFIRSFIRSFFHSPIHSHIDPLYIHSCIEII